MFARQLLAQSICQSSLKPFRFIFGQSRLCLYPANPSRSNNASLFFTQSVYVGAAIPTLAGQEIRHCFIAQLSIQLCRVVFLQLCCHLASRLCVGTRFPDNGNSCSGTIQPSLEHAR